LDGYELSERFEIRPLVYEIVGVVVDFEIKVQSGVSVAYGLVADVGDCDC